MLSNSDEWRFGSFPRNAGATTPRDIMCNTLWKAVTRYVQIQCMTLVTGLLCALIPTHSISVSQCPGRVESSRRPVAAQRQVPVPKPMNPPARKTTNDVHDKRVPVA